jgi:hypothetical protein
MVLLAQQFKSVADRETQFTAIFGDLKHKEDVYTTLQDFGPRVEPLFSNESQAKFLKLCYPELVPPPSSPGQPPSSHTLGTIFEFHYYRDVDFRFTYLNTLRAKPCWCRA